MPFIIGLVCGIVIFYFAQRVKIGRFEQIAEQLLKRTDLECKRKELESKERIERLGREKELALEKEREQIERRENRIVEQQTASDVERLALAEEKKECKAALKEAKRLEAEAKAALESLAGLSESAAREHLISRTEKQATSEMAKRLREIRSRGEKEIGQEATTLIATALGRMALDVVSELAVTTVALPSEEIKKRIIGREGRNIRTLELLTGVNFLVDDAPNTLVISGLDPMRKQIAKSAVIALIQDGRIHPTKIEECVERARLSIDKETRALGKERAEQAAVFGLHPELTKLLGSLYFRYSRGQNVLQHAFEVSQLMGIMASELGLDSALARRIGLLHDIGEALSHEVDGPHAAIGHDYALRYGESQEVANGIGCHHDEMPPMTIEGSLCSAANALSGSRPGARHEAIEHTIRRLRKLEALSLEHHGVEKAYALAAGKEIRVIVEPSVVDDAGALLLAQKLAAQIEREVSYPGKIKVTVIREQRAIEYAT